MAAEFHDIRFRSGEKTPYKDLNNSPQIRFRIPVTLDTSAHKVSLIAQSQLASVNLPITEKTQNVLFQYRADVYQVFQHLKRMVRCIIDFSLEKSDSITLRNALFLCRSIGGKCWDDDVMVLKQINNIGPASVLKLVNAGIRTIEALENTEPHRVEIALKRMPPFGHDVVKAARAFPRLRVMANNSGKPVGCG